MLTFAPLNKYLDYFPLPITISGQVLFWDESRVGVSVGPPVTQNGTIYFHVKAKIFQFRGRVLWPVVPPTADFLGCWLLRLCCLYFKYIYEWNYITLTVINIGKGLILYPSIFLSGWNFAHSSARDKPSWVRTQDYRYRQFSDFL